MRNKDIKAEHSFIKRKDTLNAVLEGQTEEKKLNIIYGKNLMDGELVEVSISH